MTAEPTQSQSAPRLSAILPVFNGEEFLADAIASVQAQTASDFELIIVDDGSEDGSLAIAKQRAERDPRTRVLSQTHRGAAAALNAGLRLARGAYVAVVDADDVNLPQRFERQLRFMKSHPNVAACGAGIEAFGLGPSRRARYPAADAAIRCELLFSSPCAHPTLFWKADLFRKFGLAYSEEFSVAYDYELLLRAAPFGTLGNIPEDLVRYRRHSGQITITRRQSAAAETRRLWERQFSELGLLFDADELAVHEALAFWRVGLAGNGVRLAEAWLRRLRAANESKALYPEPFFSQLLSTRWLWTCNTATHLGWWTWRAFHSSPLTSRLDWPSKLRFFLKCLARPMLRAKSAAP